MSQVERVRVTLEGVVQGVGFRPYVYRLAQELGLRGWVENRPGGVLIDVEGSASSLGRLRERLVVEAPPAAKVSRLTWDAAAYVEHSGFEIRESASAGAATAWISPDLATCSDCFRELFDPLDRRYLYPFVNCTQCGPRYSIVESLPYDRSRTTMRDFEMCGACKGEYEDPSNRRYHAEPNACPDCGPEISLMSPEGLVTATRADALELALGELLAGRILAVKGIGGFHLVCDARRDDVVLLLRERKRREEKPFAVLFPSIDTLRIQCEISEAELRQIESPAAPIVIVKRNSGVLSSAVAPGNPNLGVMLPSNPLHRLILSKLGFPVVATSGNRGEEPLCTENEEALDRLGGIADAFLVHNRRIQRGVDDSIVRFIGGRSVTFRSGRGLAPHSLAWSREGGPKLALGGQLKNTVALSMNGHAYVSPHVGDLSTISALHRFESEMASLTALRGSESPSLVVDAHPDYVSTQVGRSQGEVTRVPHHFAHALSCLVSNGISPPLLCATWDGTGLGEGGALWGGEFVQVSANRIERVGTINPFRLLGGEAASRDGRRVAFSLLWEAFEGILPDEMIRRLSIGRQEALAWARMSETGIGAPRTSSIGRLFDGIAALLGVCLRSSFEGQAAMALEFEAERAERSAGLSLILNREKLLTLDWRPMVRAIVSEKYVREDLALGFHEALASGLVEIAKSVGERRVGLSGGCFQNRLLSELAIEGLRAAGLEVYWHSTIPPNDGGISVGQLAMASWNSTGRWPCV